MDEQLVGLRQPDQRSCGPSCLVVARMLLDPAYAAGVSADNFDDEVLALHRTVTRPIDARGALQLPWPRALGTPPWAVARQLSALDAERTYSARLTLRRGRAFDRLATAAAPSVLYVGSRLLPRHVVLVVSAGDDWLRIYEPSRGSVVRVAREAFNGAPGPRRMAQAVVHGHAALTARDQDHDPAVLRKQPRAPSLRLDCETCPSKEHWNT